MNWIFCFLFLVWLDRVENGDVNGEEDDVIEEEDEDEEEEDEEEEDDEE